MHMYGGAGIIAGLSLLGALAGSAAAAPARTVAVAVVPGAACRFDVIGSGRVVAVLDGRSLALDDGREVRLAGIDIPSAPNLGDKTLGDKSLGDKSLGDKSLGDKSLGDKSPGDSGPRAAAALAAKAGLESLVLGQTVELRQHQQESDRYGRILAFVSLLSLPEGAEPSVAHWLIGRGFARVGAGLGDPACTTELLSRK
jgi:endonuclease YncB( thermonuclease family)